MCLQLKTLFPSASSEDNKQDNGTQLNREEVRVHRAATSRLGHSRNKKEPNESNARSNITRDGGQNDTVIPLCLTLHFVSRNSLFLSWLVILLSTQFPLHICMDLHAGLVS